MCTNIANILDIPPFIFQVGTDRHTDGPGNFFLSPECARLNTKLHGQLMQPAAQSSPVPYATLPVSFGFDYANVYAFKSRSTGIVCMRWALFAHCFSAMPILPSSQRSLIDMLIYCYVHFTALACVRGG